MKNKFTASLFALLVVVSLTGCENRNDPSVRATNQHFANNPEFVADTPHGKLFRIWVDMGSSYHADRVYFFEKDTNSITVNETHPSGKTSYSSAVLLINGVEYVPKQQ